MNFKSYASVIFFVTLGQLAQAADITIFDKVTQAKNNNKGWWGGGGSNDTNTDTRGIKEDNETEPGTEIGQKWDLEAFHLNGTTLNMIGGFNFLAGEGTYASGDIFIDVNGDAVWGPTTPGGTGTTVKSNDMFKYDYVIRLNGRILNSSLDSTTGDGQSIDGTYDVFKLSDASSEVTVASIGSSNPWTYYSGGQKIASGVAVQSAYTGGLYQGYAGNDTHYQFGGFDLSFIPVADRDNVFFKFTMECGNDNLIGVGKVPDSGMTLAMFGLGISGLAVFSRRIRL